MIFMYICKRVAAMNFAVSQRCRNVGCNRGKKRNGLTTKMNSEKEYFNNIVEIESEKFNNRIIELFRNIKSIPGELNEEKIAVACMITVHFDCRY